MKQCNWQLGLTIITVAASSWVSAAAAVSLPGDVFLGTTLAGLDDRSPTLDPATSAPESQLAEADRLLEQGNQYFQVSEFQAAIESWQQALALYQTVGNRRGEGNALGNLGIAYFSMGQYHRAIEFHQDQLTIAREIGDRQGETISLGNLGGAYYFLGQYEHTLDLLQDQLNLAREIGDRQSEANALANLGSTYNVLSQYQQALALQQEALLIRREIGDRHGEADTIGNLGIIYRALGEYQQATHFLQQQLEITRDIGDRHGEANTLGNLGSTHNLLGQYERAIDFLKSQLTIAREINSRQLEADALGNLGSAYHDLAQYERAAEFHQQQVAITRAIGDRQGEAIALGNLGVNYYHLGQYQGAIELQQQALTIRRNLGDRQGEANSLSNLGLVYSALAQYEQAIELYEESLAIARDIGDRRGEATILSNLGLALITTHRFSEAEPPLRQSIAVYESLRAELADAQLITLADTQAVVYELLELALIAQDKFTAALEITERARARAFVLQLARRAANRQDQNIIPEIEAVIPPTAAEIQQIARDQNATLVTYSLVADRGLHIWVVQPSGAIEFRWLVFDTTDQPINPIAIIDDLTYRSGPETPSDLDTLVTDTRAGIAVVTATTPDHLKALHQVLIDPIADLLPTDPNANIIFIPQGKLFLVPFAALKAADGSYLLERHTVLTAPSVQALDLAMRERNHRTEETHLFREQALVVGNPVMPEVWIRYDEGLQAVQLSPLPGAEAEAVAIANLINIAPLIGAQATEARVKQQLPRARLIHLATHGLLDYGNPQASGVLDVPGALALTPGHGEDGLLTAAEILGMDLQAELAILSACDTGRGRITGDGVIGLSRALITAGVPSVIVSLWAVPDAPTAALMAEFYHQLQQGQPKAQALRQAMLAIMTTHPDPKDWAAFTLIGVAD